MTREGPIVWIDDESDPGAWDTHIAHTPSLAAQCRPDEAPDQEPDVND